MVTTVNTYVSDFRVVDNTTRELQKIEKEFGDMLIATDKYGSSLQKTEDKIKAFASGMDTFSRSQANAVRQFGRVQQGSDEAGRAIEKVTVELDRAQNSAKRLGVGMKELNVAQERTIDNFVRKYRVTEEVREQLRGYTRAVRENRVAVERAAGSQKALAEARAGGAASLALYKANLAAVTRGELQNIAAMDQATAATVGLGRGVQNLLSSYLLLSAAAVGIGGLLAREFIQAGEEVIKFESRVVALTGSMTLFDDIVDMSKELGIAMADISAAFTRFAIANENLNKTNDELLQMVESVTKLGIASGASVQELNAGVIQLGQSLASGRLQGDELRSVLENIPLVAVALADAIGVTTGELKEMGAAGELTSDVVANGLLQIEDVADDLFERMPFTSERAFAAISTAWGDMVATMLEVTGFEDWLQDVTEGIVGALEGMQGMMERQGGFAPFDELRDQIVGAMQEAFSDGEDLVAEFARDVNDQFAQMDLMLFDDPNVLEGAEKALDALFDRGQDLLDLQNERLIQAENEVNAYQNQVDTLTEVVRAQEGSQASLERAAVSLKNQTDRLNESRDEAEAIEKVIAQIEKIMRMLRGQTESFGQALSDAASDAEELEKALSPIAKLELEAARETKLLQDSVTIAKLRGAEAGKEAYEQGKLLLEVEREVRKEKEDATGEDVERVFLQRLAAEQAEAEFKAITKTRRASSGRARAEKQVTDKVAERVKDAELELKAAEAALAAVNKSNEAYEEQLLLQKAIDAARRSGASEGTDSFQLILDLVRERLEIEEQINGVIERRKQDAEDEAERAKELAQAQQDAIDTLDNYTRQVFDAIVRDSSGMAGRIVEVFETEMLDIAWESIVDTWFDDIVKAFQGEAGANEGFLNDIFGLGINAQQAGAAAGIGLQAFQGFQASRQGGITLEGLLGGGVSGAALGSLFGLPGAAIGGGIGIGGSLLGGLFGSGADTYRIRFGGGGLGDLETSIGAGAPDAVRTLIDQLDQLEKTIVPVVHSTGRLADVNRELAELSLRRIKTEEGQIDTGKILDRFDQRLQVVASQLPEFGDMLSEAFDQGVEGAADLIAQFQTIVDAQSLWRKDVGEVVDLFEMMDVSSAQGAQQAFQNLNDVMYSTEEQLRLQEEQLYRQIKGWSELNGGVFPNSIEQLRQLTAAYDTNTEAGRRAIASAAGIADAVGQLDQVRQAIASLNDPLADAARLFRASREDVEDLSREYGRLGTADVTENMRRLTRVLFEGNDATKQLIRIERQKIREIEREFDVQLDSIEAIQEVARSLDLSTEAGRNFAASLAAAVGSLEEIERLQEALEGVGTEAGEVVDGLAIFEQAMRDLRAVTMEMVNEWISTSERLLSSAGQWSAGVSDLTAVFSATLIEYQRSISQGLDINVQKSLLQDLADYAVRLAQTSAAEVENAYRQQVEAIRNDYDRLRDEAKRIYDDQVEALRDQRDAIQETNRERLDGLRDELDAAKAFVSALSTIENIVNGIRRGTENPASEQARFGLLGEDIKKLRDAYQQAQGAERAQLSKELAQTLQQQLRAGGQLSALQRGSEAYEDFYNPIVAELKQLEDEARERALEAERIQAEMEQIQRDQKMQLESIDDQLESLNDLYQGYLEEWRKEEAAKIAAARENADRLLAGLQDIVVEAQRLYTEQMQRILREEQQRIIDQAIEDAEGWEPTKRDINYVKESWAMVRQAYGVPYETGLNYVPYDNMPARLHQGERVLTRAQNEAYNESLTRFGQRAGGTTVVLNVTGYNASMIKQQLREVMPEIRKQIRYR